MSGAYTSIKFDASSAERAIAALEAMRIPANALEIFFGTGEFNKVFFQTFGTWNFSAGEHGLTLTLAPSAELGRLLDFMVALRRANDAEAIP